MQTLNGATLVPAYGRDYKTAAEVISAFQSGKDFSLASLFHGSGYVSRSDFSEGDKVFLRYSKLRKLAAATVAASCPAAAPGCAAADLFGTGGAS